jgi:hypothetical protein
MISIFGDGEGWKVPPPLPQAVILANDELEMERVGQANWRSGRRARQIRVEFCCLYLVNYAKKMNVLIIHNYCNSS